MDAPKGNIYEILNGNNGICKDITGLGRWGNGDVELFMEHQDELD